MSSKKALPPLNDAQLGEEAADWLVRLEDSDPQTDDPHMDPAARNAAFLEWVLRSPQHLSIFLQTREIHHQLGLSTSAANHVDIGALLAERNPDVIPLFGPAASQSEHAARWRLPIRAAAAVATAATVVALTVAGLVSVRHSGAPDYTTGIGEQRTFKLEDGSFVYLNTDSRLKVEFSRTERHLELLRGEALFVVEYNPARPFIVSTSDAKIWAVGTQFNVRQIEGATQVTVVEGVVQVSDTAAPDSPAPGAAGSVRSANEEYSASEQLSSVRLAAGEEARVDSRHISKAAQTRVADALSWRQRRLVFREASLAEVAAEFNRYNRTKIRVEVPNGGMDVTGAFDADRPIVLVQFAQKQPSLSVEQRADEWVIRRRAEN